MDDDRNQAGELWHERDLVFPNPIGRERDMAYLCVSFYKARSGLDCLALGSTTCAIQPPRIS